MRSRGRKLNVKKFVDFHLQIIPYDFYEQTLGNIFLTMVRNGCFASIRMDKPNMRALLPPFLKTHLFDFLD
jgi:hypothetical protein